MPPSGSEKGWRTLSAAPQKGGVGWHLLSTLLLPVWAWALVPLWGVREKDQMPNPHFTAKRHVGSSLNSSIAFISALHQPFLHHRSAVVASTTGARTVISSQKMIKSHMKQDKENTPVQSSLPQSRVAPPWLALPVLDWHPGVVKGEPCCGGVGNPARLPNNVCTGGLPIASGQRGTILFSPINFENQVAARIRAGHGPSAKPSPPARCPSLGRLLLSPA